MKKNNDKDYEWLAEAIGFILVACVVALVVSGTFALIKFILGL